MADTMFKVKECFCLSCGSKLDVDDVDNFWGRYTDVYYICPKCSMLLIVSETYEKVEYRWFDIDTAIETKHIVSKTKRRKY